MFEKILDKIDEWNSAIYDWQRCSDSRGFLVFCLYGILLIPVGFVFIGIVVALLVFFGWATGALLGV